MVVRVAGPMDTHNSKTRSLQETKKKYYQQATYEDKISTFPQQSAAFFLQKKESSQYHCYNKVYI